MFRLNKPIHAHIKTLFLNILYKTTRVKIIALNLCVLLGTLHFEHSLSKYHKYILLIHAYYEGFT